MFIVLLASSDFAVFDAVVFEESGLILKGKKSLTWDSMVMSFGSLFFVCRFELLVVFCLVWKNMAMFFTLCPVILRIKSVARSSPLNQAKQRIIKMNES